MVRHPLLCTHNESNALDVMTRKRKYETTYNLVDASVADVGKMASKWNTSGGGGSQLPEVLTMIYDRLCEDIEWMIKRLTATSPTSDSRYATVRAIQVISLLNKDMRLRTAMTPRVAACVFYQLRCRPTTSDSVPPYENVPYVLDLSTPLPKTSVVYWDEAGRSKRDKAMAKIARAPPPRPDIYYEKRRLDIVLTPSRETRLRLIPTRCEGLSWNDALDSILENERLPDLENAPAEVHAYVSSCRERLQRDMGRTSKSKRCCVNRGCRREYPCYESKMDPNDFHERILFHLFPKTDRHYTRYWLELLRSYVKTSIGSVSFCSSICFEQCWVPRMRDTLGSTEWALHVDDVETLDEQKDHTAVRVHAVLKCLVDRNKGMQVDLKRLIERDQRSSTCLRERDIKAMTEMMIYVINMDTTIVMLMSTLRATGNVLSDPCPKGWRAKLSVEELRQYTEGAMCLLNLRQCWHVNASTSLIHTTSDLASLQRYCRQHIRTNSGAFVKLR